jgi:hypothetical protein
MKTLWELPGGRPRSVKVTQQTARFVRALALRYGFHYTDEVHLRAILNIIISLGFGRPRAEKVIGDIFRHQRGEGVRYGK